jgi:hypothetical protein
VPREPSSRSAWLFRRPWLPNARARHLDGFTLLDIGGQETNSKLYHLRRLSDRQLLAAINDPIDNSVIFASRRAREVYNGNHRVLELRRRVAAGRISPNQEIVVQWLD